MRMLRLFLAGAALALATAGCADTARQKITLPPGAAAPAPQTVFGEATLAGGDPAEPPALPQIPDRPLTLEECLSIAQKVSPSLDSADQAQVGALWNRWQSITAFLPAANTSYQVTRYNDLAATGRPAPPFSGLTQYAWQASVTQPLFTGGRNTAGYLLARLGVAAADIRRVEAREDLILGVKRAYFGILASEKALEVAKTTVVNLKSHLNVARNFFDVGMVPKNQVLEADVELAKAVQQENTLTRDVMVNKARLNIFLRRPVDAPVAVVDALRHNPFPLALEECLRLGLADRPEIKLGRNQVEASAKNIDVARSELYPTVGLAFTNTSAGDTSRAHGGWSQNDAGWNVAALASFNFWEWGRTKAEIEKSKVELNRAVDALTGLEDETKLDVTSNYHRLISDGLNIDVSAKAVGSAAEDLRMVNERYLEQVATNTEVLDAQTRYSQVQYDYYTALYNYTLALMEDVGPGDLTSRYTIPPDLVGGARLRARGRMVLSGLPAAAETMRQVDEGIVFTSLAADGDHLEQGAEIARLRGPAASILAAERVCLNFLMRLSGVATLTARYVEAVGTAPVAVVDTRKTTPGLRFLEKAAVRHGGGRNHRFALYDGILIKDNHIAAAGSIAQAVGRARAAAPHTLKIEVEVDDLDQLRQALEAGADLILLDNMAPDLLRRAVEITAAFYAPGPRRILLEASGGITLGTIGAVAQTGVDLISVGAITHSAPSMDLGLDWD